MHDVALVFEGGGMHATRIRRARSSVMLEQRLFFDDVYGLSAGATNAIDYVSRDAPQRSLVHRMSRRPLVSLVGDAVRGRRQRRARRCTADARVLSSCALPFDFGAFQANPARACRPSTATRARRSVSRAAIFLPSRRSWSASAPRRAIPSCCRRRSSTGVRCTTAASDEAAASCAAAMDDGLSRFFVVCTRPRGFRRPLKPNRFYDAFFWRRPRMREALDTWNRRYDAELDRLDRLGAEGRAYVFYANDQGVKNTERDAEKLARNYERGRMQALSEFDKWERFLSGQGV
ncbi:MAG: DUF6363 domain-containing protein [Eggerthellaceae bacterium]